MGPGENAGAVDVGDGLAVAFKVESHNHPSAVEPFQGAATGVGGILRDIFAIGARPIAVLDSLRFGEPTSPRSRFLLDGAVSGIGHYGNSIGVPTVGGEVYFEGPYEQNCLVNAMALGLAEADADDPQRRGRRRQRARALRRVDGPRRDRRRLRARFRRARRGGRGQAPDGPGRRPVRGEEAARVLARAARARAARLAPGPRRRGPDLVGLRDGLEGRRRRRDRRRRSCRCASPTSSRSRSWCPSRRSGCCASSSRSASTRCSRCATSGTSTGRRSATVTDTGRTSSCATATASWATCRSPRSSTTARSTTSSPPVPPTPLYPAPAATLGAGAPRRARRCSRCSPRRTSRRGCRSSSSTTGSCSRGPSGGPRRPTPRCCTLPNGRAIATSIDGNGRKVACDPYWGTVGVVLECASNLACAGAEPLGTTNNLNFGNPEKPHIAWQLTEAVRAIGDACRALDAPIVGGNVSLYNEGAPRARSTRRPSSAWSARSRTREPPGASASRATATLVALAGPVPPAPARVARSRSCAASRCPTGCPTVDIAAVRAAQEAIRDAVRDGSLSSAHDVAEGGLLVAVAECCLAGDVGRVARARRRRPRRRPRPLRRGPGRVRRLGQRGGAAPARRARRRSTSSAASAATRSR